MIEDVVGGELKASEEDEGDILVEADVAGEGFKASEEDGGDV